MGCGVIVWNVWIIVGGKVNEVGFVFGGNGWDLGE